MFLLRFLNFSNSRVIEEEDRARNQKKGDKHRSPSLMNFDGLLDIKSFEEPSPKNIMNSATKFNIMNKQFNRYALE